MSDSDREHLLGYLLDALDDHEREQVERALECRVELREQLAAIKHRLDPLACDRGHHVPPAGLAKRTCSWLAVQVDAGVSQPEHSRAIPSSVAGGPRTAQPSSMRANRESAAWYSWSLADMLVSAGIAMVAAMLFFPAITHSRHRSQVLACQNNMYQLGIGLQSFALHHNGLFPQESPEGDRAFAGIFGPDLVEGEYLTNPRLLLCPAAPSKGSRQSWRVPRLEDIVRATDDEERRLLQLDASGDLAYCLGYLVDNVFTGPRDNRRPTFAILSDVPCLNSLGFRTANHAGCGQNVLFEDGHVQYLTGCTPKNLSDHLFLNDDGEMRAGRTNRDSVLAPGYVKP